MTLFAVDGPGPAALLSQFQVAALALQVQGALEVRLLPFREEAVAFGAALHRLALAPDVAPALVDVMALSAGDAPFLVAAVAEGHQRLFPGPPRRHPQQAGGGRLGGGTADGPQQPRGCQDDTRQPDPGASAAQGSVNPGSRRRRKYPIPRR